jgi:hypothetical protein
LFVEVTLARTCMICEHPQVADIDAALATRTTLVTKIARDFGVPYDPLYRHRQHMHRFITVSPRAAQVVQADTLLDQVEALRVRAMRILDKAEQVGDYRGAAPAIREARGCLELLARLMGEIKDQGGTTINLVVSPQWVAVRGVIIAALAKFPEARQAVVEALRDANV